MNQVLEEFDLSKQIGNANSDITAKSSVGSVYGSVRSRSLQRDTSAQPMPVYLELDSGLRNIKKAQQNNETINNSNSANLNNNSFLQSAYDLKSSYEAGNIMDQENSGNTTHVVPKPPPGTPQRSNNIYPTRCVFNIFKLLRLQQ